jgi:hypothetical protein
METVELPHESDREIRHSQGRIERKDASDITSVVRKDVVITGRSGSVELERVTDLRSEGKSVTLRIIVFVIERMEIDTSVKDNESFRCVDLIEMFRSVRAKFLKSKTRGVPL